MNSGSYPAGAANDSNAPYNQPSNPEKTIQVAVTMTVTKVVNVPTSNYIIDREMDEDGSWYEDIIYTNLEDDVKRVIESLDLNGWEIDDFEYEQV